MKIGDRVGRLVIQGDIPGTKRRPKKFICLCNCGKTTTVVVASLTNGDTRSCGCLRNQATSERSKTHGKTKTPEYKIWSMMKDRCQNPKSTAYHRYGARGIYVCDRWQSFENFYLDMGPKPTKRHEVERKDNDGPYAPENCIWVTRKAQTRNRCNTIWVVCQDGTKVSLVEECERLGLDPKTIRARVNRGRTPEDAISSPIRMLKRSKKVSAKEADGIPGPNTCKKLAEAGYAHGIWVERPGDE